MEEKTSSQSSGKKLILILCLFLVLAVFLGGLFFGLVSGEAIHRLSLLTHSEQATPMSSATETEGFSFVPPNHESKDATLVIAPFPFKVELFIPETIGRGASSKWQFNVTNTDDKPHTLQAISLDSFLAGLTYTAVSPDNVTPRRVKQPDGSYVLYLDYGISIPPHATQEIEFESVTYLGISIWGNIGICADGTDVGHCFSVPVQLQGER